MPKISRLKWEQEIIPECDDFQIQGCNTEALCSNSSNSQHTCSYSNCPLTRIVKPDQFQKTLF